MGKKDAEKKGSLKKIIIFLAVTHPLEALMAARKARKLGLNPRRWFLATLLFGVFASSRMKEPVVAEAEPEKAPKAKKEKKSGKEKPEPAKKEKKAPAEKKDKKTKKEKVAEKPDKIVLEVVEVVEGEAGKKVKGRKNKKSK